MAKELGKTVKELTRELTREEMVGWAAYFKIQNEDMEREREAALRGSASRTQKR